MKATTAVFQLAALAHEHRLAIFRLLVKKGPQGLAAGLLAQRMGLLPSSLTFHLKNLEHAGLVSRRRVGRQILYTANFQAMNRLVAYLTENCCGGPITGLCDATPAAKTGRSAKARQKSAGLLRRG
jgi:ArsR family transcriptional regulator